MVLGGPCFVLGLFARLLTGATLYRQDGSFIYVDIYPASAGEKSSIVSPLPKPGQLLAVVKAWNEKCGEGAGFAFRVLLAGNSPSLRLEGGRFIKILLIPNVWCMNNLPLLFHPFSPKAKNKIKTVHEM